mgnify:CR=1 FL=1
MNELVNNYDMTLGFVMHVRQGRLQDFSGFIEKRCDLLMSINNFYTVKILKSRTSLTLNKL